MRAQLLRWGRPAAYLLLAVVFLYAAYLKLRQPWLVFAISIDAYGLLPEWAVLTLARVLPWLELALGVALTVAAVVRRGARLTATAATALLGGFFAAMVFSYIRGKAIDCGCFGLGDPLGVRTLVRDGALLAVSVALSVLEWRSKVTGPAQQRIV